MRELTRFAIACGDRSYPLSAGDNVIGRDPECDISLLLPSISRHHAKITVSCLTAFIEDLGSKNGTYIGEQRLESRRELLPGLTIRLGRETLQFVAASDPTQTGY